LVNAFTYVTNGVKEHIITPVENVMKDVFGRGNHNVNAELLVSQEDINIAKNTITEFLENLLASGDITAEKKKEILGTIELGNSTALLELMNQLWNSGFLNKSKFFTSAFLWSQFKILTIGKQLQEKFANIEKQYIGIGKIAVLTPAVLSSWFAHGRYQAFTTKDYSSIRRALIDINSLFVDTAKPLDDESYGKMLYVIYNLKKRAEKDVPLVDRADFIQDLERIESKEFDVAAKRRIIEDMFRKYSFLKLA